MKSRLHTGGLVLSVGVCGVLAFAAPVIAASPILTDLNVDSLTLEAGHGVQAVPVSVRVLDVDSDLDSTKVKAVLRFKNGSKAKIRLSDDGIGDDSIGGDGIYSGRMSIDTDIPQRVLLTVKAKDRERNKTRIGAVVSVVDTATAPSLTRVRVSRKVLHEASGVQIVTLRADAHDPDGNLKKITVHRLKQPGKRQRVEKLGVLNDDGVQGDVIANDGIFTIRVPLDPATHDLIPLVVTAKDQDKHTVAVERDVFVRNDTTPPELEVSDPQSNMTVSAALQVVSGTVFDENLHRVRCNGQRAAVADGQFTCPALTFAPGTNEVTVSAVDREGNRTTITPRFLFTDSDTMIGIAGKVAKGPIHGARVRAYSFALGSNKTTCSSNAELVEATASKAAMCRLAETTTDDTGQYLVAIPSGLDTPVFIEARGDDDATYIDEATGRSLVFAPEQTFGTLIPPPSDVMTSVAVTPLTHMAAEFVFAVAERDVPSISRVKRANAEISARYGLSDIVSQLPADISMVAFAEPAFYGLTLAGLSQQARTFVDQETGQEHAVDPVAVARALADDFSDGVFDGKEHDRDVTIAGTNIKISSHTATQDLAAAIVDFQGSRQNGTGLRLPAENLTTIRTFGQTAPPLSGGLQRFSSADEFALFLNDVRDDPFASTGGGSPFLGESGAVETTSSNLSFSTTTIQETGVDEGDIVKTDGTHIYRLNDSTVRIVRAQPIQLIEEVATVTVLGVGRTMFIRGGELIVLSQEGSFGSIRTNVTVIDISIPAAPEIVKSIALDGTLFDSRLIDGQLVLILEEFLSIPPDTVTVEQLLVLLPRFVAAMPDGSTVSEHIVDPTGFYRPVDLSEGGGLGAYGGSYTIVTMIDMESPDVFMDSIAIFTRPSLVYVSNKSLYVASSVVGNRSVFVCLCVECGCALPSIDILSFELHKIRFSLIGPLYTASGHVPGQPLDQFSFSEYEGALRVATTTFPGPDFEATNNLYVLTEVANQLEIVGSIENLAPEERIQSARFLGERGFLVTFPDEGLRIDPFFTLDLSNALDPKVAGELKVPGFSTLLLPFSDTEILAFGQDADTEGRNLGLQLSLFDVAEFDNPTLKHRVTFAGPGATSPALANHKAFTYFPQEQVLSVPFVESVPERRHGATVYRVTTGQGFELLGNIYTDTFSKPFTSRLIFDDMRSVFIDDHIYVLWSDILKVSPINDVDRVMSPIVPTEALHTLRNNSVVLFDEQGEILVPLVQANANAGVNLGARFAPPSRPLVAASAKVKFNFETLSGVGNYETSVLMLLRTGSSVSQDFRSLSLELSAVAVETDQTGVRVSIPAGAVLRELGTFSETHGSTRPSTTLPVGSVFTTAGPSITFDPNALRDAFAAAGLVPSGVDNIGNFEFTVVMRSPGSRLILAPSGTETCTVNNQACRAVTQIQGTVTTVP